LPEAREPTPDGMASFTSFTDWYGFLTRKLLGPDILCPENAELLLVDASAERLDATLVTDSVSSSTLAG